MIFLLGSLLLAPATRSFAENLSGAYTLSPFIGGYTFSGKQELETAPVFGLRGGYNFTEQWGAELVFSYLLTESNRTNQEADIYRYGADILYHFMPEGRFVPFVAAGFGNIAQNNPGLNGHSAGVFNYGAGIKYFVADRVALRGDVRHLLIPSGSLNNLEYTAGLTFLFGGKQRPVQAAAAPAAMAPAPAKDTTAPTVTLAVPFNANVDVPLHRKVRVAFSEAMDPSTINAKTFTVYQGKTPVPGSVLAPTGTTGSFTQTGNFAPGTLYTATLTTGAKDLAGNPLAADYVWSFTTAPAPDLKSETKVIFLDKLVMLEDSHFEFDKATLTKEGEKALDQNIKILNENPQLKVRIAGFTSAQGTVAYNQRLSERRADTVMTYLINSGSIAPGRLDTIGYGETRPLVYEPIPSDIESKAAKANMRVLFEVIVK
jgi:OOP family OmpA-OmpF porin